MKKVVVLGSTGSLGVQALEILKKHADKFQIIGLSAHKNASLLKKQAKQFKVSKTATTTFAILSLAKLKDADLILNLISGLAGLRPSLAALKAKKTLLLANKETVVAAGPQLKKHLKQIIPLDSEHNAIFEILRANPKEKIEKIYLPCSGGPLWNFTEKQLQKVTPAQVLNHPRWKMGKKISVESATLINKGLEIIEAHYLFNVPIANIVPFYHPEAKIHGMIKFKNHPEPIAYVSKPDMKEHIENALLFPDNSKKIHALHFFPKKLHHKHLKGIDIVLANFHKNPKQMKKFLLAEEKAIQKFLSHPKGGICQILRNPR
ncbi:MAG: 1-deoxy-D-xylulose-5-phosphate reductoisomerase [Candidatus Gracilibacteria bacterium]